MPIPRAIAVLLLCVPLYAAHAVEDLRIDLHETGGVPTVKAQAIFDATPQRVFDILDRCADYKNTLIAVLESKELARTGDTRRCEMTVDMPFPLADVRAITEDTVKIDPGKSWQRSWRLIEGDYRRNSGSWTLTPDGADRTRVVYAFAVQLKTKVPRFLIRLGQRQMIPDLFAKLEAEAQGRELPPPSPLSE